MATNNTRMFSLTETTESGLLRENSLLFCDAVRDMIRFLTLLA
jgi:hypothetical protein